MAEGRVISPRTARMGPSRTRRRSARFYLAEIDDYRRSVDRGEISSADGARRVAMAQVAAGVLLAAKEMELRGMGAPIDVSPDPEEEYQAPLMRPHVVKRIAVKEGTGREGQSISETTVTIETGGAEENNQEAVIRAAIEALM
jgi:hypothetical protein